MSFDYTYITHLMFQIMYQYYLLGFSNAYKTLYIHSGTIYVRVGTEKNIPHINFMREKSLDCFVSEEFGQLLIFPKLMLV
jgi:hypothetical protein